MWPLRGLCELTIDVGYLSDLICDAERKRTGDAELVSAS